MVLDDVRQQAHSRTRDQAAVQPGLVIFLVKAKQQAETVETEEIQVAEIKDQRSLQPRKATDFCGDALGVRRVDVTLDAEHGGQAAHVNTDSCPVAVGLIAALKMLVIIRRARSHGLKTSHDAPVKCGVSKARDTRATRQDCQL